jgi:hypothetical protein
MEKELRQKEIENAGKEPYEPPKATFVPLKIEERLMACLKLDFLECGANIELS